MEEWKEYKLGDLFERVTRKNTDLESENVLTISAQHGLINQEEFFNKSVAGKNLEKYYLLKKGEFAYNKSYSAGYPVGATKMLNRYDEGIVSTLYICFRVKCDLVDSRYFEYYFESKQYYDKLSNIVQEGARNHGLLNVSAEDFFNIKVKIPNRLVQAKIVSILEKIDSIIEKNKKMIDSHERQKKYFLNMVFENNKNWKKTIIKECLKYEQPTKYIVQNKNYSEKYSIPVLTANKGFILGYTNEKFGIYEKGEVILYDDFTMDIKYVNFPFKVKSSAIKILTSKKCNINLSFMYYLLKNMELIPDVHSRTYLSRVQDIVVYLPKYEEQCKIAKTFELYDEFLGKIKDKIKLYTEMKKNLIQNLLTGKVDINV